MPGASILSVPPCRGRHRGRHRVHHLPDTKARLTPTLRRTTTDPITPIIGDRAWGSTTVAGSMAAGSDSVVKVCPLLTCQQFFLRRTAGPPAKRDQAGGFFFAAV